MQGLTLFDAADVPVSSDEPKAPITLRARPADAAPAGPLVASTHRPTLLAVDGDSLVHRAYHGYGPDPTAALYGVLALLAGLSDLCRWQGVVVGFDERTRPWRREVYPAYKAHRPDKPPSLSDVLAAAPRLLDEVGVCVVTCPGHEADDVLGSAAAAARRRGWASVLATSDRDAFALVDDHTTVLRLRSGLRNAAAVTPRTLTRALGIRPGQYLQLAALRGDPSDNLPGLTGIGASRAAALLDVYPTIADAVSDPLGCRSVLGPELGQALIDDWDAPGSAVRRNLELMAIVTTLPVDVDACVTRAAGTDIEAALTRRGLGGVAGRVAAAFGAQPDVAPMPLTPPDDEPSGG